MARKFGIRQKYRDVKNVKVGILSDRAGFRTTLIRLHICTKIPIVITKLVHCLCKMYVILTPNPEPSSTLVQTNLPVVLGILDNLKALDQSIFDDHRDPLGPDPKGGVAKVGEKVVLLAEGSVPVDQEGNVVLVYPHFLSPVELCVRVGYRAADDLVHPLGLKFRNELGEARDVSFRTCPGEGCWDEEEHNLPTLENVIHCLCVINAQVGAPIHVPWPRSL